MRRTFQILFSIFFSSLIWILSLSYDRDNPLCRLRWQWADKDASRKDVLVNIMFIKGRFEKDWFHSEDLLDRFSSRKISRKKIYRIEHAHFSSIHLILVRMNRYYPFFSLFFSPCAFADSNAFLFMQFPFAAAHPEHRS